MRAPIRPPTAPEERRLRAALRPAGQSLRGLPDLSLEDAVALTGLERDVVARVRGYHDLQRLRSVGPSLAAQLMIAGYGCRADLAEGNPVTMYATLCARVGRRVDPCVEDVFRCAVAQVRYPDMPAPYADWWAWTGQRGLSAVPYPGAAS